MSPSFDEFLSGRSGWREEHAGFSYEVRWGGRTEEDPDGHWWWSVCVSERQIGRAAFDALSGQALYWMRHQGIHSYEFHTQTRTMFTGEITDDAWIKMSRRAGGQSLDLAAEEAKGMCTLLAEKLPTRRVWSEDQRSYV